MGSYTGDLKCNLKSVRMTDKVYEYVQTFQGEGFNQKFENMVLYFMEHEKQKRETIMELDKQIAEKSRDLRKLEKGKELMDDVLESLQQFKSTFSIEIPHDAYTSISDMIRHAGYTADQEVIVKIFRLDQTCGRKHSMESIYQIFKEQSYRAFPEEQELINDIVTEFQHQEMTFQKEIALEI